MKRYISLLIISLVSIITVAQVPYFGTTAGKNMIYNYSQFKIFPGENRNSFYTSFQYGVFKNIDIAMNFNSGTNTSAWGVKYNFIKLKHANVGLQPMLTFDHANNYQFNDVNVGLFINGYICKNLSYISNTWYTHDRNGNDYKEQWTYLGYDINKVTVNLGVVTDLNNDCKSDFVVGLWFPIGHGVTMYTWGGNLTSNLDKPKVTIGTDFKF